MAYDSKTYGQSPFGQPFGQSREPADKAELPEAKDTQSDPAKAFVKDGPEKQPASAARADAPEGSLGESLGLASRFPSIPTAKPIASDSTSSKTASSKTVSSKTASSKTASPDPSLSSTAESRRSRATSSKSKPKSTRKSKKTKVAETTKAKATEAELAVARRFSAEDRQVYLSLLYKTGISGLVWAVVRLLRHELPEDAIALINTAIHPFIIATIALIALGGLTFWMRHLLNDLARHTQQLQTDAELTEGKNYRPTLEIVGDSLEYNPHLRKKLAAFYNAASTLICSLVSYLVTFALFPTQ
ncbi:MAG: hypothetical protein HC800_07880 [Phormidesmis sp. RL_2_1]|nr:hypothetical protein [Phormidesmis sp. RL_2_1]